MYIKNLDIFIEKHKNIINRIGQWVKEHKSIKYIDPKTLSNEIKNEDPIVFSFILVLLANLGFFQIYYKITLNNVVINEKFYTIDELFKLLKSNKINNEWDFVPVFHVIY